MNEWGSEQQALVDALNAEYAATFAYGVVGAFSNPARAALVASYTAAHRARRDSTIDALKAANITAPSPAPAYSIPFPVTDPISAAQLAAQAEVDTTVAWLSVIERSESGPTREIGITALTEAALRLASWRVILGVTPSSIPFPGRP